MVLQRLDKTILLNSGLDTKQSDAFQDAGSATQVDNLHYDQMGELVKRPGLATTATLETLSDLTTYTNTDVQALVTHGTEVLGISADYGIVRVDPTDPTVALYTHRATSITQTSDEIVAYAPKACTVSRRILASAQGGPASGINIVAATLYGGVLVSSYLEEGTLVVKATDPDTGVQIGPTQYKLITGVQAIQSIPCYVAGSEGVLIVVVYGSGFPYTADTYLWNAATYDLSDSSVLSTNLRNTNIALAPAYTPGNSFYFAFTDNTSGFATAQYRTIATVATTHTSTRVGLRGVGFVISASTVLLGTTDATTVGAEILGTPASVQTLLTAVGTSGFWGCACVLHPGASTKGVFYANEYEVTEPHYERVRANTCTFTGSAITVSSNDSAVPHTWLASAPFSYDGRVYCPITIVMDEFAGLSSVILTRYTEMTSSSQTKVYHEPVARLIHNRYVTLTYASLWTPPNAACVAGNKFHMLFTGDKSPSNTLAQTLFQSTVTFAGDAMPLPYVEALGTTYIASGLLTDWDGQASSTGTPLTAPGVAYIDALSGTGRTWTNVAMVAVYTWIDHLGNLHRSAPSPVIESGVVANKQVDVYVPLCPFDRNSMVYLSIGCQLYLTEDSGTSYYISEEVPTQTTNFWKWTNIQDAGLPENAQLYSTGTGGNERVPTPPPAFRDIALVQDRLVGIDAEDPTRIWYSKPFSGGYAPEWTSLQTLTIGSQGMAVRDLGGIIAILAKDSTWVVDGIGPDAVGNGSFSLPRKTGNVGCIDSTAVVSTPAGIFFRSQRGFQLLDQSFNAQFIGLPIEHETRFDSLTDYVSGRAIWDELSQEVRFLDYSNTCQWLYHVGEGKWSKYTGTVPNDLLNISGRTWALTSSNTIAREYSPEETNSSTSGWIYRTPWLTLNGLAGFGRVWELILQLRVRSSVSNSTITVAYETRAPDTATETFTYTGAQLATFGSDIIELRLSPTMQKCKSLRLTVTETCSAAYAGTSPLALQLIYGASNTVKTTRTNALKGSV